MPDLAETLTFRPEADPRRFRDALGCYATGVTIVTCNNGDGPLGITANSFASVSLSPPLVLWSPARASLRFQSFVEAEFYAIHVLGDRHKDQCRTFASEGGNFSELDWQTGDNGVPLIEGCLARFECRQHAVHDGGDHAIVVGQVIRATIEEGSPLVFARGSYGSFRQVE